MIVKRAQESDPVALMSFYVGFLRALYNIHQTSHWKTKGNDFYGNHLLFQRLYEATQQSADEAAEKTIGLFDELKNQNEIIKTICQKFSSEDNYVKTSLEAEQAFLKLSKAIYDKLKSSNVMTLGLDDLVMAIAGRHEVHVYLLKQSLENGDNLPGGRADNLPANTFDPEQLKRGTKHEMEHTDDPEFAKEIAKDHLAEDNKYYDKLEKLEASINLFRTLC